MAIACGGPAEGVLVLHTADAYGYFDDCGCAADSTGGLAKRAWVVDSLRRDTDLPVLLVDAGDFSGGENAYGAALGRVMGEAMGIMEYDAFTLGEWDLHHGPAYLREIAGSTGAVWVHTNYDVVGLEDLGRKTLLVEKSGRRIGVIGLFNPTIPLNPAVRDSVVIDDPVESARAAVTRLRGEGAEVIVALSHLGREGSMALADEVAGIDLIVTGHGGTTLDGAEPVVPGTWLVGSGSLGRHLGVVRVGFGREPPGARDVEGEIVTLGPSVPDDPRLDPVFARHREAQEDLMRREIEARRSARPARPADTVPERGAADLRDLSRPR